MLTRAALLFSVVSFCVFTPWTAGAKGPPWLTEGAFTDVPPTANAAYISLVDGGPLHILSGITGVEFHVPEKASSEPGGLSPLPHPILKKANGVEYWFVSGELSGYVTEENGQHIVIGPIDLDGVNHRNQTFNPDDPEDPSDAVSHPRAGLPGAFFALSVPVKGFNRSIVNIEPAGDGGFFFPSAPVLFNPVDPIALLKRGYAVFAFGQGGTVSKGLLPNGTRGADTNPDSGTGIFWQDPFQKNEPLEDLLALYTRFSFFDEQTGKETTLPTDFFLTLRFPIIPGEEGFCGEDPICSLEGNVCACNVPFGDPGFIYGSLQKWNPEIISDSILFAKNLVRFLFPRRSVTWAAYVGWSGSGSGAIEINSSTRGGAFQAELSAGPQAGGGNYVVWGDPGSGLRYDAFLSYAGVNDFQVFLDHIDKPADVNPAFPVSAPLVWFVPEYDATLPQSAAYDYANRVWQALARLNRGHEVNDFIRIYSLPKATHQARDQLFAAFDSGNRQGGLWYDYRAVLPDIGAFNENRRGFRVSDPYVQSLKFNDVEFPEQGWDSFFQGKAKLPRDTPLWLQTLDNLRDYSRRKIPLPVSRVDSQIFNDIDAVSIETARPAYSTVEFPSGLPPDEFVLALSSLSQSVQEDTGIPANPDFRPPFSPSYNLNPEEVEELKLFASSNPLKRSTEPLLLPDVAAPTGAPGFYLGDTLYQRNFTREEFKARYKNRLGYVVAFSNAAFKLIAEGLWEPQMGLDQILEVLTAKVDTDPKPVSGSSIQTLSLGSPTRSASGQKVRDLLPQKKEGRSPLRLRYSHFE